MTWRAADVMEREGGDEKQQRRAMEPVATARIDLEGSRSITCVSTKSMEPASSSAVLVGYSSGAMEARGTRDMAVQTVYEVNDALSSGVRMASSTDAGAVVALTDTGSVCVFDGAGEPRCTWQAEAEAEDKAAATATCVHAASSIDDDEAEVTHVAVGYESGTVSVFAVSCTAGRWTSSAVGRLRGHTGSIISMFHLGQCLVTSSQDQTVRVWDWTSPTAEYDEVIEVATAAAPTVKSTKTTPTPTSTPTPIPIPTPSKSTSASSLTALLPGLTMASADPTAPESEFRDVGSFVTTSAASMAEKATSVRGKDERQSKALSQRAAALYLWHGDVGRALGVLVENDALTSDFVAFAAGAGRDAWIAAARVYADYLERKGEVHLAALYRVQAGDVVDATQTYERHKLHREAAALAELRLSPDHPLATRAMEQYGTYLARAGMEAESALVLAKARNTEPNQT